MWNDSFIYLLVSCEMCIKGADVKLMEQVYVVC